MTTTLSIGSLALILIASVAIHEAAHAVAMRSFGVPVVRSGLGVPLPPRLSFTAQGVQWTLTPWLVAAYVEPSQEGRRQLESLSYRDMAWYANAGIVANLLLALGASAFITPLGTANVVSAGLAICVWLFRRQVAAYVIPALAVPAIGLLVVALARSWSHGESGVGFAGLVEFAPTNWTTFLDAVVILNFSLAMINILPMYPADNGRVVDRLVTSSLGQRASVAFRYVGLTLVVVSLIGAVASDLYALIF